MQFGANADIYLAKTQDEILARNVNQLDLYNSIAKNCIKCILISAVTLYLPITYLSKMIFMFYDPTMQYNDD